jgi:hypothetical protein
MRPARRVPFGAVTRLYLRDAYTDKPRTKRGETSLASPPHQAYGLHLLSSRHGS